MSITNFKVAFERKTQPADYEHASSVVEFSGVVPEGVEPEDVSAKALALARKQVLRAVQAKPIADQAPAEEKVEEKPKRKRRTKAEIEADKKAEAEAEAKAEDDNSAEIPMDDAGADEKDTEVEDWEKGDTGEEAEPITDSELQNAASQAVSKLGGADKVKALMKDPFKVAKLGDLAVEKRADFIAELDKLVEASKR